MARGWRKKRLACNMQTVELLQTLHNLVDMFGAVGALGVLGWWYERRANQDLQRRLMRLVTAQMQATGEVKSALEAIREILRR